MDSSFGQRIQDLVKSGGVRVSEHGFDEMAEDGLSAREAVAGVDEMVVVAEYPDYPKGPCALVLEHDRAGRPFHVVWGIPLGYTEPVVLVTAYRPDPERWDHTFTRRAQ